jgi:hypothetical protein
MQVAFMSVVFTVVNQYLFYITDLLANGQYCGGDGCCSDGAALKAEFSYEYISMLLVG